MVILTRGTGEMGLLIAKDDKEVLRFTRIMNDFGFKESKNINEISRTPETYFVIKEDIDEDMRHFVSQYPEGRIKIFDRESTGIRIIVPDYENSSVMLIATKEVLEKFENEGFVVARFVGPAWQN